MTTLRRLFSLLYRSRLPMSLAFTHSRYFEANSTSVPWTPCPYVVLFWDADNARACRFLASAALGSILYSLVLFLGSGVCGESRNDRSFSGLDCRSFGVWNLIGSVALHDSLHTSQVNASGMLGLDVRNFGSRIHVCVFSVLTLEGTGMDPIPRILVPWRYPELRLRSRDM